MAPRAPGFHAGGQAPDAAGAEIRFAAQHVTRHFVLVRGGIGFAAVEAHFLVGEGDHAHAARGLVRGDQVRSGHADRHAGAVIDGAGPGSHESRCPPIPRCSSGLLLPRISPITLAPV
jgi:hypothetical protein